MSLKSAIIARLHKMLKMPGPEKAALVLDNYTLAICQEYLGKEDKWPVTSFYYVDQPTKSQARYAVYFITQGNISALTQDLKSQNYYEKVWIFFPRALLKDTFVAVTNLKKHDPRIKEVVDNVINFTLVDERTVVTGHPDAFRNLSGPRDVMMGWLTAITHNVASVVATLGEKPVAYYADDSPTGVPKAATQELMTLLQRENALSAKIPQHSLRPEGTADLLIVDRSIDPVAPFVVEMEYDSLLHDVMGHEVGKYGLMTSTNGGPPEPVQREMELLSDSNKIWVDIRHRNFRSVAQQLSAGAAKLQADKEQLIENVHKLKQAKVSEGFRDLNQLPLESKSNSYHQALYEAFLKKLRERRLFEIGEEMEKILVTDGADVAGLVRRAGEANRTESYSTNDLIRLLICTIAGSRPIAGSRQLDERMLAAWQRFGITHETIASIIDNLRPMGVDASKPGNTWFIKTRQDQIPRPPALVPYDWSQYVGQFESYLSNIIHQAAGESLPPSRFAKWASHLPRPETSLRIGFDWTKRTLTHGDVSSNTRRLIVVLLGGATRGEVRQCHQLAAKLNRNIILITTAVLSPAEWLQFVAPNWV